MYFSFQAFHRARARDRYDTASCVRSSFASLSSFFFPRRSSLFHPARSVRPRPLWRRFPGQSTLRDAILSRTTRRARRASSNWIPRQRNLSRSRQAAFTRACINPSPKPGTIFTISFDGVHPLPWVQRPFSKGPDSQGPPGLINSPNGSADPPRASSAFEMATTAEPPVRQAWVYPCYKSGR
jgi:hypothetical protein